MEFVINSISRTNRKTVSIGVLPSCEIVVRAPMNISDKEIFNIIEKHKLWVAGRIKNYQKNKFQKASFKEGEVFRILGKEYVLKFRKGQYNPTIKDKEIHIDGEAHKDIGIVFEEWFKYMALRFFNKRANLFFNYLKIQHRALKISNAKTRWGSCSSRGSINISWRLIMAPIDVIDYVILHEIAHIKQANHSHKFWTIVENVMPEYKNHKKWLKENGHTLNF